MNEEEPAPQPGYTDVYDFINRVPMPGIITGRGNQTGKTKQLTITLLEAEYEAVRDIAHDPMFRVMYQGTIYQPIRHAIQYFLWDLAEIADEGEWLPTIQRLKQELIVNNLKLSREQILELLDTIASGCHTLLDYREAAGAQTEFVKLLTQVSKMPDYWRRVIKGFILGHPEMVRVMNRLETAFGVQQMAQVWEETLG